MSVGLLKGSQTLIYFKKFPLTHNSCPEWRTYSRLLSNIQKPWRFQRGAQVCLKIPFKHMMNKKINAKLCECGYLLTFQRTEPILRLI